MVTNAKGYTGFCTSVSPGPSYTGLLTFICQTHADQFTFWLKTNKKNHSFNQTGFSFTSVLSKTMTSLTRYKDIIFIYLIVCKFRHAPDIKRCTSCLPVLHFRVVLQPHAGFIDVSRQQLPLPPSFVVVVDRLCTTCTHREPIIMGFDSRKIYCAKKLLSYHRLHGGVLTKLTLV